MNIPALARWLASFLLAAGVAFAGTAHGQEESEPDGAEETEDAPDVQSAREILKRTLTPGAPREEEVRYLLERERAAATAGAYAVRLEVLRRLVELHKDTPEVYRYWGYLWREEWRSGNQQRALEIGEQLTSSNIPLLWQRARSAAFLSSDYLEAGDRAKAWSTLQRAEQLFADYGKGSERRHIDRVAMVVELQRGRLLMSEGRYAEADATLRKALDHAGRAVERSRNTPERDGHLSLYQSDRRIRNDITGLRVHLLSNAGRHAEAEAVARQALSDAVADQAGVGRGYWQQRIALTMLAQRRYADALALTDQAIDIFTKAGLGPSANRVLWARNSRLQALIGLERWTDANVEYAAMLQATADDAIARRYVNAPLLEALLRAMTGQSAQAVDRLDRLVRFRARIFGDRHPLTVEAKAVYALAQQGVGNATGALATYREVFAILFSDETLYVDTATRGLRGFYLPLALQHYLKLAATLAAGGQATSQVISDAFVVADRLRDSVVQQAIIDAAARSLVEGNSALAGIVRAEQDARISLRRAFEAIVSRDQRLQELRREIQQVREQKGDAGKAEIQKLGLQIKEVQAEILEARKVVAQGEQKQKESRSQLMAQFPDYFRLINPKPMRPADVATRLAPGEAMISIYAGPQQTFVWAIKRGAEPVMHVAASGAPELQKLVASLRNTIDLEGKTSPLRYDFASAHRLYALILEPIAKAWTGERALTIVSSGPLGQIPFALLTTQATTGEDYANAPWLVKEAAIAHVSSASAWASVRDNAGKAKAAKPFVGFGDPLFSASTPSPANPVRSLYRKQPAIPALPETRDEIVAIANALGADVATSTFFGPSASRAQVMKAALQDHRVLAFATHGLKAGDLPGLSQPALALAMPQDSRDSPFLTLDDVLKLKIAAELVVLSACNTASDDGTNEEAISGLGRGFFFAGARSMLLTHWAVESRSAQHLVTRFFKQGADNTMRAERLRQAQLEMIGGKADPMFRHPAFWAPYALAGDAAL